MPVFLRLPTELHAQIAGELDDSDLAAYSSSCRAAYAAVYLPRSPVWRRLYFTKFDHIRFSSYDDLRLLYQRYSCALRNGAHFVKGQEPMERECLLVIRDLILTSYGHEDAQKCKNQKSRSRNLDRIQDFQVNHGLLSHCLHHKHFDKRTDALFITIQVILMHMRVDPSIHTRTFSFPDSQKAVYQITRDEPIFQGRSRTQINMRWVLHAMNFFKYHMTNKGAALEPSFADLTSEERPKAWRRKLVNGVQKLGRKWKGCYTYLDNHELIKIREGRSDEADLIEDRWCDNGDGFQTLDLRGNSSKGLPSVFEKFLRSRSHPSLSVLRGSEDANDRAVRSVERQATKEKQISNRSAILAACSNPKITRSQSRANSSSSTSSQESLSSKSPSPSPYTDFAPSNSTRSSFISVESPKPPHLRHFQGHGTDEDHFLVMGSISALPPQQGIPGWQRFTMMKFFPSEDDHEADVGPSGMPQALTDTFDTDHITDATGLWAYEGIVLPGGEIVVGRWWSCDTEYLEDANEFEIPAPGVGVGLETGENISPGLKPTKDLYSGPFMFWCVDEDEDVSSRGY